MVGDYLAEIDRPRSLDVGCGPCDVLKSLGDVDYVGVDFNPHSLDHACRRYGDRGQFLEGNVYTLGDLVGRRFDAILALGVLQHLNDDEVTTLFRFAQATLAPGGLIVTHDPRHVADAPWYTRALIASDRGRNVRSPAGYEALARSVFPRVESERRDDAHRLPYVLHFMRAWAS
jgi:SAM-dependent methyltransferase